VAAVASSGGEVREGGREGAAAVARVSGAMWGLFDYSYIFFSTCFQILLFL
jgi:hypothetical protein